MSSVVLAVSCASAPPPAPKRPAKAEEPPPEPAPAGSLDRGALELVLRQGPPWLLERVPIEEVLEKGKFVGWRLRDIPIDWQDVDIRAGDVVTAVNAMPLETPTDFWAAWTTLSVASELKIAYLRDGEPLELSIPIYGSPNPKLVNDMQKRPGPESAPESPVKANQDYAPPKRKKTITIKGDDKPLSDTLVDWSD